MDPVCYVNCGKSPNYARQAQPAANNGVAADVIRMVRNLRICDPASGIDEDYKTVRKTPLPNFRRDLLATPAERVCADFGFGFSGSSHLVAGSKLLLLGPMPALMGEAAFYNASTA